MTFKTKFPIEQFFNLLSTTEPQSVKDIADKVGCTPNTAKSALFSLEKKGNAKKKLISGKYYVWWKVE